MRILQVVNNLQYGGLEKLVIGLSAALNHGRHESLICCLESPGPMAADAQERGIPVRSLGKQPGFDLGLILRLAKLMKQERIDVVHTHNMGPLLYGALAAKLAGCRAVLNTRHGREWKQRPSFVWRWNRAVVAISEDARTRLLASNRVDPRRVRVIANGIDLDRFAPATAGAQKPRQGMVFGTVARLAQEKDHATLLRAFATLGVSHPDAGLVIVGDGELRLQLERLAAQLGVSARVAFLGFQQDVAGCLQRFDCFVLSSVTEGISLTLLEAMAAAKPVIATRVGGNPEVVEEGVTGLLVPPSHPDALAAAMQRLLTDRGLAERMGQAGRARAQARFSLARMAEAYGQLYEDLSGH